ADEVGGHVGVEQVAHGVDEHPPRFPPTQRLIQLVGMQSQSEAWTGRAGVPVVLIAGLAHRFQPLRQSEGVAVVTAGRHPVAARRRIPRPIGPLDRRVSHWPPPPRSGGTASAATSTARRSTPEQSRRLPSGSSNQSHTSHFCSLSITTRARTGTQSSHPTALKLSSYSEYRHSERSLGC